MARLKRDNSENPQVETENFPLPGEEITDAEAPVVENTETKTRRKYTRRAKAPEARAIGSEAIAGILYTIHLSLAVMLKEKLLILEQAEAQEIAKAIENVTRHYDVQVAAKTIDWTRLVVVLGTVYGKRAIMFAQSQRMKKASQEQANAETPHEQ